MNTNTPKVLFLIIIGILVVNLAFNLFGSGKTLRDAVRNLENARKSIDTALLQIQSANTRLDSIQANLDRQREVIKSIYVRTELMDLEKKVKDAKSKAIADSIRERIEALKDFQPSDSTIIPIVNL
jgi:multidrug resistance efflux pump